MEKVCPLCNGLEYVEANCPACGSPLLDGGTLENYYGPYSPYMDKNLFQFPNGFETHCIHLVYCPQCHYDIRMGWNLVEI